MGWRTDPRQARRSVVAWSWTQRTTIRWVMRCQTVVGAVARPLILDFTGAEHVGDVRRDTPNSPGWLNCPVGHIASKSGLVTVRSLAKDNPDRDVSMELTSVTPTAQADGTLVFRVDAFERRR